MRVLVAIADHGTAARHFLDRLVEEYRSMPHDVDLVVLSDVPKDLGPDIEVRVGVPSSDPWSLPFAHRPLFIERADDYDLFVYTENDTLITQRNIEAYLELTPTLAPDEILGFLRSEQDEHGARHYPMIHGAYRWLPETLRERDGLAYAALTNEHAASYLLTRAQLRHCIDSGGYATEPHEGRHDMLCAAATDPYTRCGLTRLLCLDRLDDFTLPHLSNRYATSRGITQELLERLVEVVIEVGGRDGRVGPLVNPENELPGGGWWKNLYETPRRALLDLVPSDVDDVLVVGTGWGATEEAMVARGQRVTAVPIDPVLGRLAADRGVEVVEVSLGEAPARLGDRRFGCVVVPDLLHLVEDPAPVLRSFLPCVADGGSVVLSVPNVAWRSRIRRLRRVRPRSGPVARGYERSGVHSTSRASARRWLRGTGFAPTSVVSLPAPGRSMDRLTRLVPWLLAGEFVVRAERGQVPRRRRIEAITQRRN